MPHGDRAGVCVVRVPSVTPPTMPRKRAGRPLRAFRRIGEHQSSVTVSAHVSEASGVIEGAANDTRDGFPPLGWEGLALCVRIAYANPEWDADKVERRARQMLACNVDNDDDLYLRLRRAKP